MIIMKNLFLCFLIFIFLSCNTDQIIEIDNVETQNVQSVVDDVNYEQGFVRILVSDDLANNIEYTTRSGIRSSKALASEDVVEKIKIRKLKRTFPHAGRFEERSRKAGLHLWYDVEFDGNVTVTEANMSLQSVRGVKFVEPRPVVARFWDDKVLQYVQETAQSVSKSEKNSPFNDPQLPDQWHYKNDGSLGSNYKAGADVNVYGAWQYTTGTPDVVVAIIDGGIDYTHEDLAANMWINQSEKNGSSLVDDDGNGFKDDIYGYNFVSDIGKIVPHNHGTHVAGTVAAVSNNGKGVAGVAGGNGQSGTGVRLMSCQIFVNDDDPYASSGGRKGAPAIKYAADNGAVICQNSWGYPTLAETPASDRAAIDYFIQYAGVDENGRQTGAMRGGIVIFAAGNENRAAAAPATYEKVVAVSSIGPDYRKAYYSNYGEWTDLAAPGGDVQAFGNKGTVLSTLVGGKYGYMQGTSMACPHVSGVAALVLSYFKRSGYNPEMLRARLENSSKNIDGFNSAYSNKLGGLVNAMAALAGGSTLPPNAVADISVSVKSNVASFQWKVPSDPDDGKASGFNVYVRKSPLTAINVNNPPSDVTIYSFSTGDVAMGSLKTFEIGDLNFETTYYFAVNAFDFSGNFSSLSTQSTFTTLVNNPPVLTVIDSVNVSMKAYQNVFLNFDGVDPDQHQVFWKISNPIAGASLVQLNDRKAQLSLDGTKMNAGVNTVVLKLEDKYGAFVTQNIHVMVFENQEPQIISQIDNVYFGGLNKQLALTVSDFIRDADNEPLKYVFVNTAPGVVNVNESRGKFYFVALAYGLAEITIKASDAMGAEVSQRFKVLVRDDNRKVDIYPNPVRDNVWIRTGSESSVQLQLINTSGAVLIDKSVVVSPFDPVMIDMSKYSAGVYNVKMKIANDEIIRQIVKL